MTINEFTAYLKNTVTDEMFEALVLDCIKYQHQILFCHIGADGNKIYSLQDTSFGNEYYLIIDTSQSVDRDAYDVDKYMIASKDEETLFLLANNIWGEQPRNTPANARCLLPFLNQLDSCPIEFFNHTCVDFSEHIDEKVQNEHDEYKRYMEGLYDKCVDAATKTLIQEEYLLSKEDWNRKTKKIKLTGAKGENRVCECYLHAVNGCVFFTVKSPFNMLHYHLTDETDIPLLADRIVEMIKSKKPF